MSQEIKRISELLGQEQAARLAAEQPQALKHDELVAKNKELEAFSHNLEDQVE